MKYNKAQVYSFGKRTDKVRKDLYKPGPGQYSQESKTTRGYSFGKTARIQTDGKPTPE